MYKRLSRWGPVRLLAKFRSLHAGLRALGPRRWFPYARRRILERLHWGRSNSEFRLSAPDLQHTLVGRCSTSDIDVFRHVFVQCEYACVADLPNCNLILDCGANVGYSTCYFLSKYPSARVIAIEPDPENYSLLTRNVGPFGDRVQVLPVALWNAAGMLVLDDEPFRDGREWSRRVREPRARESSGIEALDMQGLLQEVGASRVSLLKMDIEGAERLVFDGPVSWLNFIDAIAIELHDSDCESVFLRALRAQPFDVSRYGELTICRRRVL
ncbi:MAG: FkbM family methyltransferase [Planctomycetaceae bacterium]|nr:FkbM family methyltransferase [Planctomycetaceae bacterium]